MNARTAVLATMAATALVATGCGGGSHHAAATNSLAPAAVTNTTPLNDSQAAALATQLLGQFKMVSGDTTRGISGHTITVGGISTETAGGQPEFEGMCDGAKARFARANREGGVAGYKINYLGCTDDGGSEQTNHQVLETDGLQKHAFAIVPWSSVVGTNADGTFLEQNHVPFFGFGENSSYCGWNTAPFAFATTESLGCQAVPGKEFLSSYTVVSYDQYKKVSNPADEKWAFVGFNTSGTRTIMQSLAAIAKSLGHQVVYEGTPGSTPGSPPITNWDPIVEQVLSGKPTVVLDSMVGADEFGFLGALRAQGYTGDVEGVAFNNPLVLGIPSLAKLVNGTLAEDAWVSSDNFQGPSISRIDSDLKAIGSKQTASNFTVLWGYQSADFFLDALKAVSGKLTAESLVNRINSGYTYPGLPNALCPTAWPQGHVTQSNYAALELVDGTTKSSRPVTAFAPQGANYYVPVSP